MIRIALVFSFALAACVPETQTSKKPLVIQQVPCPAASYQGFVGQHKRTIKAAKITNSVVRVLEPDSAVTLDYNKDRLNFILDDKNIIQRVQCG